MFKKFLLISIVLFIVVLVSGCGKEEVQPIEEEQTQEILEEAQSLEIEKDGEGGWEEVEGEFYFLIPEMGIKFKVKEELKDEYVYYYEKYTNKNGEMIETASFSTRELVKNGKYCQSNKAPSGRILKYLGNINDHKETKPPINNYKQFGDFLVFYSGPHAVCSTPKNVDLESFIVKNLSDSIDSVKLIN